jgi:23S rRNA (pseudouridine1915-N3)-methyltransferase
MKLSVLAVGRLKAGPEKLLAEDYLERAKPLARQAGIIRLTVQDAAESQAQTAPLRMAEERRFFAKATPPGAVIIVLDERGKSMSSSALADLLRRHSSDGAAASLVLSFGAMTWPHRLARIMLFEQIYRAVTIIVNHPYHRP